MIYIVERECKKLSGTSSLFLSFKFNPDIVAAIKSSEKYIFDKKTYEWEVPLTSLAYLLDTLTYIDDITLTIKAENEEKELLYPKLEHKYPPYEHQVEGITYGLQHNNWLLLDSPGLGKTLQMIYLAEELKEQKGLEHCLIICGINTLKANWKNEIKKYSTLSCRVLGEKISKKGRITYGSIKQRALELIEPNDAFFLILNVEALRYDEIMEALKKTKNNIGMIVFDEAHKCLAGSTLLQTDVGNKRIEDIVDNRLKCKIKSFNEITNSTEYKEIDSYYKSDVKEKLIQLTILDDKSIEHKLICTRNHPIYTKNRGYVPADALLENDILLID